MKLRLIKTWELLRGSYFFLPALLALAAVVLASVTVAFDEALSSSAAARPLAYAGGPEGARAVMSIVAASMITVAGVVFSITIVALSLATSHFGPRLLRNFMRDRANQFVLGTFTATFLYCLLVLRTIRGSDGQNFVPHIAVTVGVLLAIASLGVLIYFIHHVSVSIHAASVITAVSDELRDGINWLFPEELGSEPSDFDEIEESPALPAQFATEAKAILSNASGYLQALDNARMIALATNDDLVIRLHYRPGHFLVRRSEIARAWPGDKIDDEIISGINKAMIVGPERTPTQDVEFSVNQLVEIALRALSPGINDPFTAMMCIDRLGDAICQLAGRRIPSPFRYDEAGKLRIFADPVTFSGVLDAAFNQIRQAARTNAAVTIRLLETIAAIVPHARRRGDVAALLRHAKMIGRGSQDALPEEQDRLDVADRLAEIQRALEQPRDKSTKQPSDGKTVDTSSSAD